MRNATDPARHALRPASFTFPYPIDPAMSLFADKIRRKQQQYDEFETSLEIFSAAGDGG
jgi:hypothetical protein